MRESTRTRRRAKRQRSRRKKLLIALISAISVCFVGVLGLIGYIMVIAAQTPSLSEIKSHPPGSTTEVLAANGERLGFIAADSLRQPIPEREIPLALKMATVAIEDERFYKHRGIDYFGILRAAVTDITSQQAVQGGSTITMQLVRNLYISNERTYKRKIREATLARELEKKHSKKQILGQYLNAVPYGTLGGQTAYGVEAASRMYFGKPARQLTLSQSAMLAGLPQAPSAYSPVRAPQKALARRNQVLAKMAQLKMISRDDALQAMRQPLQIKPSRYFQVRQEGFFLDYVQERLIEEYGAQTVRAGGLRVHTTIDLAKQRAARAAITSRLAGVGPSGAVVTIDPENGYIKAMASSADYGQSQFNLGAQGHRQPGSTFKIMALMTALRRGVDPDKTFYVSEAFHVRDRKWGKIDVTTYGHTYAGPISLTRATLRSDNSVYIQLALDLGPAEIKKTAQEMGITSPLEGFPSETLGGLKDGVSPLEMANAFATIASGGFHNRPTAITKVTFPNGHSELPKRFRVKRNRVFSDGVAAEAIKILVSNVESGTGTAAAIGCPAGGKTGTTDDFVDAWFVGITPKLSTAVWVGRPQARIPMRTDYHGSPVAGGTYPAEIFGSYMRVARGDYCGSFPSPSNPFEAKPFSGKYKSSRTDSDSDSDDKSKDKKDGSKDEKRDKKKDQHKRRKGKYPSSKYESPPQRRPDTSATGGSQAGAAD